MNSKIVLMYHDVYRDTHTESGFQNESAFQYKISSKVFEKQIIIIKKYCDDNSICTERIKLTFDDGGISFYTVVAPILEKYGFKGIFFISTKYIGTDKFLTREQILDLHNRGHIIGSHSHSHPRSMSSLNATEILNEWKLSFNILSTIINSHISTASIPNGYGSSIVNTMAANIGYTTLYTSKPTSKTTKTNKIAIIGRYVIHNTTSNEDLLAIISKKSTRNRLYYRWTILCLIKSILGNQYNNIKSKILNSK